MAKRAATIQPAPFATLIAQTSDFDVVRHEVLRVHAMSVSCPATDIPFSGFRVER